MKITSVKHLSRGLVSALLMALVSPAWALTPIEVAKLIASDGGPYDNFGYSVAVDGDTALIGARVSGDGGPAVRIGLAYVFTRTAGVWTEQAKLTASNVVSDFFFGVSASVAVEGDTALIGTCGRDTCSAYVFIRSAGVWKQQANLTASDGSRDDDFGLSVAIDGDIALIGAHYDDDNGDDSGSVYVFTRSAGIWTEQAKLTASDAAPFDNFGEGVALDGETALIGATGDDDKGSRSGSVYVFTHSAGVWKEQAKLTASDGSRDDVFGLSVALDGDTALLGVQFDDDNGISSGSAYVFTRRAGVWAQQAKITQNDAVRLAGFGKSVALDGDTALIGASDGSILTGNNDSAYIFTRNAGAWTQQAKLNASDSIGDKLFGGSVALDGDTALVGSRYGYDVDNDIVSGGAVYVFSVITETIVTTDIKPGSETNNINPNSNGLVAVAILTGGEFDALQLDPDTAKFGPGEATVERYTVTDVDSDGDQDLLLHFRIQEAGIACADAQATLVGELYDGTEITGTDSITTVGCQGDALIEAEFMVLSDGYAVEANADASGGQIIRRRETGGYPAQASTVFAGAAGSYDIEVAYFDELDGQSSLAFLLNGAMLDQWITDEDPRCRDCASPNARTLRTRVVARGVRLSPGDEIALQGTGDYYEYARFDNITLSRVGLETLEAEDMILDDGYVVEANADASGGQIIRRRETGGYPAQASTVFAGAAGSYDIEVAYFDELDGQSSLAFLLSGAMLDQWIADEDPRCRDCASPNARTLRTRVVARGVRLSPGDEIALQGTGDYYEYARFDNITLSRVGLETLEAEDMILDDGYVVEANADASGGQIIRRRETGGYPAQASTVFAGAAGSYDIEVAYFDELDGQSSLAFLLSGAMLDQWIADEDPRCRDCASPNARTLRTRVVARGVRLSPGDEIALQGTGEHYEYARFDKITLAPVGVTTLEAEMMTLDDGFVVEANAAASGGQIIRGNRAADSVPGQASAAFMGTTGTYDIRVTYFDEYDGISTLAVYLNDQLLAQWLADENPACRDCASPNEKTLRSRVVATGIEISTGDEIRLESTVNQYEYGRFDKIDFTPTLSP